MKTLVTYAKLLMVLGLPFIVSCSAPWASEEPTPTPTAQHAMVPPDEKDLTDALAKAGRPVLTNDHVDWDTFAEPVQAASASAGGYPIYLISCDLQIKTCSGPEGKQLGPLDAVVARLTPIRNTDAISGKYQCPAYCVDENGQIVGRISDAMLVYLKTQGNHPGSVSAEGSTALRAPDQHP